MLIGQVGRLVVIEVANGVVVWLWNRVVGLMLADLGRQTYLAIEHANVGGKAVLALPLLIDRRGEEGFIGLDVLALTDHPLG